MGSKTAHTFLKVSSNGYAPITTQIFDRDSKYLDDDSVFAAKNDLKVDFKPREGDPKAELEAEYNITLAPKA